MNWIKRLLGGDESLADYEARHTEDVIARQKDEEKRWEEVFVAVDKQTLSLRQITAKLPPLGTTTVCLKCSGNTVRRKYVPMSFQSFGINSTCFHSVESERIVITCDCGHHWDERPLDFRADEQIGDPITGDK